jgi:precorrin-2/cobalt-factor-2 C20-methyltransferase
MGGKLYGVGVGPGDPQLMTIKAKNILDNIDLVAIPKTSKLKESLALTIAKGACSREWDILELVFPMSRDEDVLGNSWNEAVNAIEEKLSQGRDVAFITLGDPTVYSTFIYIYKILIEKGYQAEIIPGITSFCAGAARSGVSLAEGNEKIAIIPLVDDINELEKTMDNYDNIVLMKIAKNFKQIRELLYKRGDFNKRVLVSKCTMEDELIYQDISDINDIDSENMSYFTTMILKKNGV